MGRIIKAVLIAAIAVVLLIVGAFLIVANFSAVSKEYVCEGETRWADGPTQTDKTGLRTSGRNRFEPETDKRAYDAVRPMLLSRLIKLRKDHKQTCQQQD